MDSMSEKVHGYVLLYGGIAIMLFSLLSLVFVFTGRSEPIQLFHLKGISIDSSALTPQIDTSSLPGFKMPEQIKLAKPLEIFPAEDLNRSANIFAHLMFMGFLLSVGSKFSTIGTNLLRPIVVKTSKSILPESPTTT